MITRTILSILTISTVLLNCAQTVDDIPRVKSPDFLTDADAIEYADSILRTLTNEERIAQLHAQRLAESAAPDLWNACAEDYAQWVLNEGSRPCSRARLEPARWLRDIEDILAAAENESLPAS